MQGELMSGISAHMIVKNEDQWVWFSIQSILPYVDELLITDTSSTDHTIEIIRSIKSSKIKLSMVKVGSSADVTSVRQSQLHRTKNAWIWIVDGDEIYSEATVKECLSAIDSDKYEGIVVRRYDLLGDIYHRQIESVGSYELFGQKGHLVTRLINKEKIRGLHYQGDYPLEGWFDQTGVSTHDHDRKNWYITDNYLYHAMYLKRSSLGSNLPMFNRNKYKVETGISITTSPPEVFSLTRPQFVPDPLSRRTLGYELVASIITPIKDLKRKFI